jgi:GDPmannose 4,6-dehydratase
MKPSALVTGIFGQDGRLLTSLLHSKGYIVDGTSRFGSGSEQRSLDGIETVEVHKLNFEESIGIFELIDRLRPTEIYHLAARSSSNQLADDPIASAQVNGMSVLYFLEAIRKYSVRSRFCFASSSEVFAGANVSPQCELTGFSPVNAYGVSKCVGMQWVEYYRKKHDLYAVSAILYNHESIYRGHHYVTRKIAAAAARIYLRRASELVLGDLVSQRDWMHASDAVRGMWAAMQVNKAEDFLLGSGVLHSVSDICEIAFSHLNLNYRDFVVVRPDETRRVETVQLLADARKAHRLLCWTPQVQFSTMIREMVDFELRQLENL